MTLKQPNLHFIMKITDPVSFCGHPSQGQTGTRGLMLRRSEKFLFVELTERMKMLEGGEPGLTQSKEKQMSLVSLIYFSQLLGIPSFENFFAIFSLQQLPLIVSNY